MYFMVEVGEVAAANLEEWYGVAGACRRVAAYEDGGVGGEEGTNRAFVWVEGVGDGEEAL
jgi:hypothetical protein